MGGWGDEGMSRSSVLAPDPDSWISDFLPVIFHMLKPAIAVGLALIDLIHRHQAVLWQIVQQDAGWEKASPSQRRVPSGKMPLSKPFSGRFGEQAIELALVAQVLDDHRPILGGGEHQVVDGIEGSLGGRVKLPQPL
jgi:hypothetical protein